MLILSISLSAAAPPLYVHYYTVDSLYLNLLSMIPSAPHRTRLHFLHALLVNLEAVRTSDCSNSMCSVQPLQCDAMHRTTLQFFPQLAPSSLLVKVWSKKPILRLHSLSSLLLLSLSTAFQSAEWLRWWWFFSEILMIAIVTLMMTMLGDVGVARWVFCGRFSYHGYPPLIRCEPTQGKRTAKSSALLLSIKLGRSYGWYPRDLPDILFWISLFFCFPLFVNWSERHYKAMLAFTFVLNFFQTQPWQNFSLGKVSALTKFSGPISSVFLFQFDTISLFEHFGKHDDQTSN